MPCACWSLVNFRCNSWRAGCARVCRGGHAIDNVRQWGLNSAFLARPAVAVCIVLWRGCGRCSIVARTEPAEGILFATRAADFRSCLCPDLSSPGSASSSSMKVSAYVGHNRQHVNLVAGEGGAAVGLGLEPPQRDGGGADALHAGCAVSSVWYPLYHQGSIAGLLGQLPESSLQTFQSTRGRSLQPGRQQHRIIIGTLTGGYRAVNVIKGAKAEGVDSARSQRRIIIIAGGRVDRRRGRCAARASSD